MNHVAPPFKVYSWIGHVSVRGGKKWPVIRETWLDEMLSIQRLKGSGRVC